VVALAFCPWPLREPPPVLHFNPSITTLTRGRRNTPVRQTRASFLDSPGQPGKPLAKDHTTRPAGRNSNTPPVVDTHRRKSLEGWKAADQNATRTPSRSTASQDNPTSTALAGIAYAPGASASFPRRCQDINRSLRNSSTAPRSARNSRGNDACALVAPSLPSRACPSAIAAVCSTIQQHAQPADAIPTLHNVATQHTSNQLNQPPTRTTTTPTVTAMTATGTAHKFANNQSIT
jgi:hypothetical protein